MDVDTNPATDVTLTTAESGIIEDLNVQIELGIDKNGDLFWSDLDIWLSHEGVMVQLLQGPKNDNKGTFDVIFDDEAISPINNSNYNSTLAIL